MAELPFLVRAGGPWDLPRPVLRRLLRKAVPFETIETAFALGLPPSVLASLGCLLLLAIPLVGVPLAAYLLHRAMWLLPA